MNVKDMFEDLVGFVEECIVQVVFNVDGFVLVIVQQWDMCEVLMFVWVDQEVFWCIFMFG